LIFLPALQVVFFIGFEKWSMTSCAFLLALLTGLILFTLFATECGILSRRRLPHCSLIPRRGTALPAGHLFHHPCLRCRFIWPPTLRARVFHFGSFLMGRGIRITHELYMFCHCASLGGIFIHFKAPCRRVRHCRSRRVR